MHVAASKPEFIKPEDVSAEVVEKEYQVQLTSRCSPSRKEIAEKMVEGRMKKFTGEVSLTGQPFVMEPSKTVGQLLKEHNADVTGFIRFEVGEGIEKVETDCGRSCCDVQAVLIIKKEPPEGGFFCAHFCKFSQLAYSGCAEMRHTMSPELTHLNR